MSTLPTPRPTTLSAEEIQQLRDALRLTPTERLRLMESLWAFARQGPNYTPKEPDQLRPRP